jgi:hypothetical protein
MKEKEKEVLKEDGENEDLNRFLGNFEKKEAETVSLFFYFY